MWIRLLHLFSPSDVVDSSMHLWQYSTSDISCAISLFPLFPKPQRSPKHRKVQPRNMEPFINTETSISGGMWGGGSYRINAQPPHPTSQSCVGKVISGTEMPAAVISLVLKTIMDYLPHLPYFLHFSVLFPGITSQIDNLNPYPHLRICSHRIPCKHMLTSHYWS